MIVHDLQVHDGRRDRDRGGQRLRRRLPSRRLVVQQLRQLVRTEESGPKLALGFRWLGGLKGTQSELIGAI